MIYMYFYSDSKSPIYRVTMIHLMKKRYRCKWIWELEAIQFYILTLIKGTAFLLLFYSSVTVGSLIIRITHILINECEMAPSLQLSSILYLCR
jgi:hypothetical protein